MHSKAVSQKGKSGQQYGSTVKRACLKSLPNYRVGGEKQELTLRSCLQNSACLYAFTHHTDTHKSNICERNTSFILSSSKNYRYLTLYHQNELIVSVSITFTVSKRGLKKKVFLSWPWGKMLISRKIGEKKDDFISISTYIFFNDISQDTCFL